MLELLKERWFMEPPGKTCRRPTAQPVEVAFYDALANNESAVRELGDEILKKIAVEITEKLRKSGR